MKKGFLVLILLALSVCVVGQGFRNPVLPGFHADPSVCRVGDDSLFDDIHKIQGKNKAIFDKIQCKN